MPLSLDELLEGARVRAQLALESVAASGRRADYAVGLEGGIDLRRTMPSNRGFLMSWAYVTDGRRGAHGVRRRHRGALGAPGSDRGPGHRAVGGDGRPLRAEGRAQQPGGVGHPDLAGSSTARAPSRPRSSTPSRPSTTPASIGEPLHPPRPRLDRGHHRQHVQRQERGADPPRAPRPDRAPARADLQAAGGRPLRRRPHREPLRHEDAVAGGGVRAGDPRARRGPHRGGGHRRGAVLRRRPRAGRRTPSPTAACA